MRKLTINVDFDNGSTLPENQIPKWAKKIVALPGNVGVNVGSNVMIDVLLAEAQLAKIPHTEIRIKDPSRNIDCGVDADYYPTIIVNNDIHNTYMLNKLQV